jgi:cytidylate kinase
MDNAACARFDQEVLKYMELAAAAGRKAAEGTVNADLKKKYLALGRTYRTKAMASLRSAIEASAEDD